MAQEDASLLGPRPSTAADRHTTKRPQLVPDSWSGVSPSFNYFIGLEPFAPSNQRNLSYIRGWVESFDTLSAIIVALPIGRITDHRGQQGVFMVVMAGILMSLTWSLIVRENSTTNALIGEVALINLILFFFTMPILLRIPVAALPGVTTTNSASLIAATTICGLGFGARSTQLSPVTSWIDPQRAGPLFSAVFLVEHIGMLGGEPLVQNELGVSLGLQDPWKGLPLIRTAKVCEKSYNFKLLSSEPLGTTSTITTGELIRFFVLI
ncbi:uncharacterized protein FFB20_14281 [Fusarium fujikuroi]|uniref:Major facilitator superfamily (MFS) profile domain-containing protein n=1 Tax=Gibberella fujikuroi (strain CBS 195.34 / IMI 58289 / NRRL A-6831) TaxID=1279085 RepID=S0DMP4_GIBF5|nr:uncharacterized protein FFUJ_05136 [Fusarium fujikuroi IMI 58289]SCN90611.1 uncharacterized protein FFE2_07025 [Fusarium fujikuroi]CCT63710.1 uncharacterized protein FFUJ_05136 [Fusarium fujikuroi IMI 58289]SCN98518.1 uncharacterized protein FFM5_06865 [Fusarium fujikuroi]SCO13422.1 uncharacterized protein FFB20_14281 [Fusarium fujikuroi]SCO19200.1 uncharacterized protein FFC1_13485 [Fusarium fujikuroi]